MKLMLGVDSLAVVRSWIGSSYNTHDDCRGCAVVTVILGQSAVLSSSLKQKLNVKSSTEGELVGARDGMSVVLWSKHFIKAQGYTVEHNKLYQDNKSTILMENNGRASSSEQKKYI